MCLEPAPLLKEETLTTMFSCQICEIFKNTYLVEHLRTLLSDQTPITYSLRS